MLLALQLNNLLGDAPTLVPVPDVVGQSQASGAAELESEGFGVAVQSAYSNTVPAGDIVSQSPGAGTLYPEGGTVTITVSLGDEPVSPNKGAGRPKRKRRYLVEIDGQDFEVSSPQEAELLLARAREVAVKVIAKARAAPVRINHGIRRPVVRTQAPELAPLVAKTRQEIYSLYDGAIRDLEIAALMAKRFEDDEEEALIRFLM